MAEWLIEDEDFSTLDTNTWNLWGDDIQYSSGKRAINFHALTDTTQDYAEYLPGRGGSFRAYYDIWNDTAGSGYIAFRFFADAIEGPTAGYEFAIDRDGGDMELRQFNSDGTTSTLERYSSHESGMFPIELEMDLEAGEFRAWVNGWERVVETAHTFSQPASKMGFAAECTGTDSWRDLYNFGLAGMDSSDPSSDETFHGIGTRYSYTVPTGVTELEIECWGGQGGECLDGDRNEYDLGGQGGYATGALSVTEGETLYVHPGRQGWRADDNLNRKHMIGGWGGGQDETEGGHGGEFDGYQYQPGSAGGAGSDVRQGGDTYSERVIVAGGGGGGFVDYDGSPTRQGGGGGGSQGEDGYDAGDSGGYGGTQSSGGDGGTGAGNGGLGDGGDGEMSTSDDDGGAGGGGGYYGGGGAEGYWGSGGGGSGYTGGVSGASMSTAVNSGRGQVRITYTEPPGPPENVDATYQADDQVDLSWDQASTGGEPDSYDIEMSRDGATYVSPAGGPSSVSDNTDGVSSHSASYGPSSDQSYDSVVGIDSSFQFRVRAVNSNSASAWSTSDEVRTSPVPPHSPNVSRSDANTFTIAWTNQTDIAASGAGTLQIEYKEDTGAGYGAWTFHENTDAANGSYTVSTTHADFSEDARYQFRIRAVNRSGSNAPTTSGWVYADYGNEGNVYFEDGFESGDLTAWDTTSLGDADSGVTSGSGNVDLGIGGADEGTYWCALDAEDYVEKNLGDLSAESDVLVKAAMVAGSLDSEAENWSVWWYDGGAWQELESLYWENNKQGWTEVSTVVPDSYLSTDNRLRLRAGSGFTAYGGDHGGFDRVVVSDVLDEYTLPAAPSALSLDASVEDEITASWTDNATFEDKYETKIRPTGSATWDHRDGLASDLTSYTFSGLDDGEEYEAFVRATIAQHRRGALDVYFFNDSTTVAAVTVLPAPTSLSSPAHDATSIDLSWTDNHDYGDTRVEYKPSDAASWTTFATLAIGTNAETVTGLRNGELYDLRVVAQTEHTTTEDV